MKFNFLKICCIGIIAALMACQNNSTNENKQNDEAKSEQKTESSTKEANKGKYQIKSGIITFESETMGMKQNVTIYFDDYGKKEATETTGNIMGIKTHSLSFMKDGYSYNIDMVAKTGTKIKMTVNPQDINFSEVTDAMMKEMNLKKEGTETFLGKTCEKWSIDYKSTGMKGTYLVWQGISLKTDITMMGMRIKMTATKIEENASIPSDKFEVPQGITITETKI